MLTRERDGFILGMGGYNMTKRRKRCNGGGTLSADRNSGGICYACGARWQACGDMNKATGAGGDAMTTRATSETRQPFCLLCDLRAKDPSKNRAGARHNIGCPKRPKPAEPRKPEPVAECYGTEDDYCPFDPTPGAPVPRLYNEAQVARHRAAGHDVRPVPPSSSPSLAR